MRLAHITTADLSLRLLLGDQLRAFRAAGFEVIGISAPGPWVEDVQRDGVIHVAVPWLRRRWALLADGRALVALYEVLRKFRPVIVHTHTPKGRILGRVAARAAGVPIVVNTFHGLYGVEGSAVRRRLFLWLERVAARWSDFDFCQSREDLDTLHRSRVVDQRRSAYLGNGVNLTRFDPTTVDPRDVRVRLGIPSDAIVVGTVGRLVWEKGYREFFAMAEQLRHANPGIYAVAVGPHEPGKQDAIPQQVIDNLERRGVVRFLGMRTDMPEMYAAMDIFVLPSYREGFPRSAVEAAAMGRALVLTDIRGCREVVADGEDGYLVPPRDVRILVDRVRRLAAEPALRERFGSASRRRALREFDERRIIAATLDVYQRLLATHVGALLRADQESTA